MPPVPGPGSAGSTAPPHPLGDPDALNAVRDTLIGPVTGLMSFARFLDDKARVSGWEGPHADAFAARMHELATGMRAASTALADGQQALGNLAAALQEAGEFWTWGRAFTAEGLSVAGLFANARDMSVSAYGVARQRLDEAANRLAPLTHQARSPLPNAMTFPVNPCGLLPEDSAGAFWNQGMAPLNTVCLGLTEVTIEVDGVPVQTFEVVPIGPDSNESKARGRPKGTGNDQPVQSAEEKVRIRALIRRFLVAGTDGDKLEAEVGQHELSRGRQLLRFHEVVWKKGQRVGEIDAEVPEAIIEVTHSPGDKFDQVMQLKNNRLLNPTEKPVILYAPRFTDGAALQVTQQGVRVVRTMEQLDELLDSLRG